MYGRVLVLLLCCCGHGLPRVHAYANDETNVSLVYEACEKLQPQQGISYKSIKGMWYVIEILEHVQQNVREFYSSDEHEVYVMSTCPTVTIVYPAESTAELNLNWQEVEGDVYYKFRWTSSLGKWESAGAQTGSLSQRHDYTQFAGTLFITKAVSDHMVLTFCSPNRQLYSLVIARNQTLNDKDLKSIKNQINRNNLPIKQTKLTCRNSSSTPRAAVEWLIAAALCLQTLSRAVK